MFYDNYIRLCNSVNKTPSAAAVEMGISKTSVNRWKNGSYPTDATMLKIASYFGVTVEELSRGRCENTAPADGVAGGDYEQQKKLAPGNGSERKDVDDLIDLIKHADDQMIDIIRRVVGYK